MTEDDFTQAARAEAEERIQFVPGRAGSAIGSLSRRVFMDGAEWARDHLATQEPTDTEVEAAAVALAVEGDDLGEWDSLSTYAQATYLRDARAALSAARATRRDEEK